MMKNIALLSRRAGLTRAQFREYYETRHAPLASRHFPFTRYVRNHLSAPEHIGFDAISEFWSTDLARLAALMQTEVGTLMRTDEEQFMDRSLIRSGTAQEYLLPGAPAAPATSIVSKHAWLLRRPAGPDPQLPALLGTWAAGLPAAELARCAHISVDIVQPWPAVAFPFDAALWFWMSAPGAPAATALPAGVAVWQQVQVVAHESPPGLTLSNSP